MDPWPAPPFSEQEQQRHKRSFAEMAARAAISPSPHMFGSRSQTIAIDDPPISFERRRTSHPHNFTAGRNFGSPSVMADYEMHPHHRPSLEHRTSQTVVDLTGDEDVPMPQLSRPHPRAELRPAPPPPRLGRSDSHSFADIVDLTEDDELQIVGSRSLVADPMPPRRHHRSSRARGHHGHAAHRAHEIVDRIGLSRVAQFDLALNHPGVAGVEAAAPAGLDQLRDNRLPQNHFHAGQLPMMQAARHQELFRAMREMVPGNVQVHVAFAHDVELDYGRHPFQQPEKPAHIPPPAVQEGFTRSPTENDVVICPACEKELIANKVESSAPVKKSGKPPSKSEREEHPFWVLRECGHVYCNSCFQIRKPTSKKSRAPVSNFREIFSEHGVPTRVCSVESCDVEVVEKKGWVGVFL